MHAITQSLTPANLFFNNTPMKSVYIFARNIARVEVYQKKLTHPFQSFPMDTQKMTFCTIHHLYSPTLTLSNFFHNILGQFVVDIAMIEVYHKNITYPFHTALLICSPRSWIFAYIITQYLTLANSFHNSPSQFNFANNIAIHGQGLSEKYNMLLRYLPLPMGRPLKNYFVQLHYLWPLPNFPTTLPGQFIYIQPQHSHGSGLSKQYNKLLTYLPSQWGYPHKELTFYTNIQSFTLANPGYVVAK